MELRCKSCNRLLTILKKGVNIEMETKCPRCGTTTKSIIKSVRENVVYSVIIQEKKSIENAK